MELIDKIVSRQSDVTEKLSNILESSKTVRLESDRKEKVGKGSVFVNKDVSVDS